MHQVYLLYSPSKDQYYKGVTGVGAELRVQRHNEGWTKSTRSGIPWRLVYVRSFETKIEALKWETHLKKQKNRAFFETLIHSEENELSW